MNRTTLLRILITPALIAWCLATLFITPYSLHWFLSTAGLAAFAVSLFIHSKRHSKLIASCLVLMGIGVADCLYLMTQIAFHAESLILTLRMRLISTAGQLSLLGALTAGLYQMVCLCELLVPNSINSRSIESETGNSTL
jgi:hypothetical protein